MNMFEAASRMKLRFPAARGDIATESLWDMPLTSKSGFGLDTIAKTVNAELKQQAGESFVQTSTNPRKATLELQMEIIKYVIAEKQAENAARLSAAENKAKREKLMEILSKKEDEALEAMTPDQLRAQIAALS